MQGGWDLPKGIHSEREREKKRCHRESHSLRGKEDAHLQKTGESHKE